MAKIRLTINNSVADCSSLVRLEYDHAATTY